jgi:hypothetical protein
MNTSCTSCGKDTMKLDLSSDGEWFLVCTTCGVIDINAEPPAGDDYSEWQYDEPSTPDNRRTRVIDPAAIYQIDPKASK